MYIVALEGIAGYDTVFFTTATGLHVGDLILHNSIPYIVLGKNLTFPALYPEKLYNIDGFEIMYSGFLGKNTLEIIHWMVTHYFSSYKHVINLFVPFGICEKKLPKKTKKLDNIEQTCIIYPDFWSLVQDNPEKSINEKTIIIHGNMTKLQKIQAFWKIKLGLVETIIATNRGLFFDWYNVHKIIIHKPTNRSYSSQSDPRFVIQEVAETYKSIYKVSLEYMQ